MATAQTILECLTGFIGLRDCDAETEPGSGLFINDLPGISSEVLQTITEAEEETYKTTWDNIERATILSFRSQLMAQVNKCFQINKMETVECLACENKDLLSISLWYLMGQQVMLWALYNWNNSRFSTVDKKSVEEITAYYSSQFDIEISSAVKGIDITCSACVNNEKECVVQNGPIHQRWSLM